MTAPSWSTITPDGLRCRECLCDVRQWPLPHRCRIYDVRCDHCQQAMGGTARQVLDAQQAHWQVCPGLFHPCSEEGAA